MSNEIIPMAKPDKTIEEHTNDLLDQLKLLQYYGYIKNEKIYRLCIPACKGHDLGKNNIPFQKRVKAKRKIRFDPSNEVPHNILSGCMLNDQDFKEEKDYLLVLHAILYHHDYVEITRYLDEEKELIERTLKEMEVDNHLTKRKRSKLSTVVEEKDAIRIKGILHKCDYSASAGLICEYPADFLLEGIEGLLRKFKKLDSKINWNDMQCYCIENREENIIVVAQTGMGKTEGALNWIGNHKGFFVLPLRTAINAMYQRIKEEIIEDKKVVQRLAILHSSSLAYYIHQVKDVKEDEEILEYEKNGKQWSIPLNITTMDQLFDFVFKYQGYELKLATLAYSKIVIDEIQMYSPDLLAYLIYGLERIYQLGGKIAIITATLPPFVEDILCKKINFKSKKVYYNDEIVRHWIKVKEEKMGIEDIYKRFEMNQDKGASNKILVVCNTIRKAREVYSELEKVVGREQVKLLHSRFIRKERKQLEDEIIKFGQSYNAKGELDERSGIWVSTSLVETSLDIDFDYLFTELQELSSLFQRFGRCNRKGKKSVNSANCIVYTEINQSDIIHGEKGFIDERLYALSKEAIKEIDGLIKESDKMELIQNTFVTENLKGSQYMREYNESYSLIEAIRPYEFEKSDVKLRHIFSDEIIPKPIYEKHKTEIDAIIENLKQEIQGNYDKVKLEEQLMEYTVAIPSYEVKKYSVAVIKNQVEPSKKLKYTNKKIIEIIDCNYDAYGFVPKEYMLQSGEGEFL